ncbi:hypothetical protein [Oceanidesulfovibrio marinus]|uniref:hypothetical protein n=1 Tax=Oceanidesulfovibrio marinus TaxID=370038 RepID=UPI00118623C4|nr:hypothetical protein [Oceanidesulfovibrio marinus]
MPAINLSPPLLTDKDEKIYTKNPFTKWRWIANPGACEICRKRDGHTYNYHDVPKRPHPNCKCRVEAVGAEEQRDETTQQDIPEWPVVSNHITGTCAMMSVGDKGGGLALLIANLSTQCIVEKRVHGDTFIGKRYEGIYKATLAGPAWSRTLMEVTEFKVELRPTVATDEYKTPLHAVEGWADVFVAGGAVVYGPSLSLMRLGSTESMSFGGQYGVALGAGWYGGRGHLESYWSYRCGI